LLADLLLKKPFLEDSFATDPPCVVSLRLPLWKFASCDVVFVICTAANFVEVVLFVGVEGRAVIMELFWSTVYGGEA